MGKPEPVFPEHLTSACVKCNAIRHIGEMFEKDKKSYCADCKPEGARPLIEFMRENTQMLTAKEAHEIANKSPLETMDISAINVDEFRKEIARNYKVPAEDVKLVGVGLYFATEDRKVTMMMKEFAGNVSQLLFSMCENEEHRAMIGNAMKMIAAAGMKQPDAGCGDGCGGGCGECNTNVGAAAGDGGDAGEKKRPKFEDMFG